MSANNDVTMRRGAGRMFSSAVCLREKWEENDTSSPCEAEGILEITSSQCEIKVAGEARHVETASSKCETEEFLAKKEDSLHEWE